MEDHCLFAIAIFVSYLFGYTMYSKKARGLVPSQLINLFIMKKGVWTFLKEMNKVAALAGLTCLGLSFVCCKGLMTCAIY